MACFVADIGDEEMTTTLIALYLLFAGYTVRDAFERLRSSKFTCLIFGVLWPVYWFTYMVNK